MVNFGRMKLLRTILSSAWAIDESYATSLNPLMQRVFSGESIDLSHLVKSTADVDIIPANYMGLNIAVLEVEDVLMREDFCGEMGTESLNEALMEYAENPSIGGVILAFNTPGGQSDYIENVVQTIANYPKPIISYVSSMCASAGYWLASNTDAIFTSVKTDRVGSIGTMISYCKVNPDAVDQPRYLQVNVYASRSIDKNRAYEEMLDGNYERIIKEVLDPMNNVFLSSVKQGRANIDEGTLTGKMYYSEEAVSLGLIDGIKSFDETVAYVVEMIQNAQNQNSMGLFSRNKKPVQMKNEVYSNILGRDVMNGEVLSVDDLQKVQAHIEGLSTPLTPAPVAEEAPVQPSLEEVVANALAPISGQIQVISERISALEAPGASATVTTPTNGAVAEKAPWEDPNRSYNKALIGA